MNDNTINPQEKIETAIDSGELKDEELENAVGGALNFYCSIKFDGVGGESISDRRHDKWIDVLSFTDKSSPYL